MEAALRVKDKLGGKITVLSLGNNMLRDVVKKPLSMGADELILLEDEAFEGGDSWSTAYALATAIKKIGQFDIIFWQNIRIVFLDQQGFIKRGFRRRLKKGCIHIYPNI